ncbi:zinc finger protein 385C-like [Aplochiton taeniatus]
MVLFSVAGPDSLMTAVQWFLTWVRSNPRGSVSQSQGFGGGQDTHPTHMIRDDTPRLAIIGCSLDLLSQLLLFDLGQLNSSAQAQIHYHGKTHRRRLRQFTKATAAAATHTGSLPQANPLLACLSLPGQPIPAQLDLKHFLPLRANGSPPLSLFPNFSTMDPVQKAVINHTFGVAQPKKKQIISCNICHLRFNSTNQAEAHYKGHKHARKLKAMEAQRTRQTGPNPSPRREREKGKDRERERTGAGESVPALVDANLTEQTGVCTSAQLPSKGPENTQTSSHSPASHSESSSACTSHLLTPLLSSQVSPSSQRSELTSDTVTMEDYSSGSSPVPESDPLEPIRDQGGPSGRGVEDATEVKKTSIKLHCPICKVTVNSTSQMDAHCSGSKHKLMLEGQNDGKARRRTKVMSSPRLTCRTRKSIRSNGQPVVGVANQQFHCELCEVAVNSETQLQQHMTSRRHKDRLAGKPAKPKINPFIKAQPNPLLANLRWSGFPFWGFPPSMGKLAGHNQPNLFTSQTKLVLQKQLSKSLSTGFLTSPLNQATLCSMASSPLAFQPPPGQATFLQAPLLSPALFRPAPGPFRATHTPILFSPY